jgi:hypothetical protein
MSAKMKAEIKIPLLWKRLTGNGRLRPNDRVLLADQWIQPPDISWMKTPASEGWFAIRRKP